MEEREKGRRAPGSLVRFNSFHLCFVVDFLQRWLPVVLAYVTFPIKEWNLFLPELGLAL